SLRESFPTLRFSDLLDKIISDMSNSFSLSLPLPPSPSHPSPPPHSTAAKAAWNVAVERDEREREGEGGRERSCCAYSNGIVFGLDKIISDMSKSINQLLKYNELL
ncbi:MAG: hypothetical protein LE180_03485, partial [Endomicrobium sp.]|uniref:hypothetical protein n=1 Tax=Candidatus Endomicrobiellum pyrsonymphae TaxID=1408203 RepID=UPI00357564AF|nr:hypothetical protein [Endomicrobium sp.]